MDAHELSQAAQLHCESLSDGGFITLFGRVFLEKLYGALLEENLGFFIRTTEGPMLKGFIFVCTDSSRLCGLMLKRMQVFLLPVLKVLVRRPYLLNNVLETFFYAARQGVVAQPELLVMAVGEEYRSKGIGTQMLRDMEAELFQKGYRNYKLTVRNEMTRSIHFYEKNGLCLLRKFNLYGRIWNVYTKELSGKNGA